MGAEKPSFIKRAMQTGDRQLLSDAGKKGADMRQARRVVHQETVLRDTLEKEVKYWKDVLAGNFHLTDSDGEPMPDDYGERVREHLEDLQARLGEIRGI